MENKYQLAGDYSCEEFFNRDNKMACMMFKTKKMDPNRPYTILYSHLDRELGLT